MPWQTAAADVAGELIVDPDTGRLTLAYQTVIVSVPRRAGKSTLVLAKMIARGQWPTPQRVWYGAQSGKNVTKKWRQEWAPTVARSPLADQIRARLSQGNEEFVFANGSYVSAYSPGREDMHSQSGDMIVFDEAWVHSVAAGDELTTAAGPLMATRFSPQRWVVSAAGDVDSTWWNRWLEIGRAAVAADLGHGVCMIHYGAPDDADHADPDVWIDAHPAVRGPTNPAGTIPLSFLADEYATDPHLFARSYLNITDLSGNGAAPFDLDSWRALAIGDLDRAAGVVLGIDCSPDQASTSIVAAGGDQYPIVEMVDHRPGHGWFAARLDELLERYDVVDVVYDPGSPAGVLAPEIRRRYGNPTELALRDVCAAAGGLVEAVRTGEFRQVPSPLFDAAVESARRRVVGDGSWTIDRRTSSADVSPLIAAMFARWGHHTVAGAAPTVG